MAIGSNLPGDIDQIKRRQNAAPAVSTPLGMSLTPDQMQEQRRAADMKRAGQRIQQTKDSVSKSVSSAYDDAVKVAMLLPRGFKGLSEVPINVYDRPFDYGDGQRRAAQWMEKNPAQASSAKGQMQDIAGRAVANALPPSPLGMPARPSALAAAPAQDGSAPASAPSSSPAAGFSGSSQPTAPATPGAPQSAAGQQPGNGWGRTGIGAGMQGGEIVGRVGANGIAEFSNAPSEQQAAQGRFSAPQLGFGPTSRPASGSAPDGARVLASGTNDPNALPRGSIANIGDGNGSFSQGQAGDSRLALDRFERANAEHARTVQASRGGIGDTGNFTIVGSGNNAMDRADARREADIAAGMPNSRAARAQAEIGIRQQANQIDAARLEQSGILGGLQLGMRGRELQANVNDRAADRSLRAREVASAEQTDALQRQKVSQDLQTGDLELARQQQISELYARYQPAAPEERAALAEQIRTMTGKEAPNRFTVVPGGQEYDAKAGTLVNRPSQVLNNQTGQFVGQGQTGSVSGMTLVGHNNGNPVYRDAKGNLHIDE